MSLKRNAWVMVLALALSGAMVAGCDDGDDTEPGGSGGGGSGGDGGTGGVGGDGGTGGVGGDGGTGGEGGGQCTPACADGEECVDRGGDVGFVCECDPNPDSCPEGFVCNDVLRCEEVPDVAEFAECLPAQVGEQETLPDGATVECVEWNANLNLWLRTCDTSAECPGVITVCLSEMTNGGFGYCWYNFCGEDSISSQLGLPANGAYWGGCDVDVGYTQDPATATGGTCMVQTFEDGDAIGICIINGNVEKQGDCEPDAIRGEADALCSLDSTCLAFRADRQVACTTDAECATVPVTVGGTTYQFDGYCNKGGNCAPLGFCGDLCNSGTAGTGVHANAGCADPAGVCNDISGQDPDVAQQEGYCTSQCTMFEAGNCPAYPAGQERACYPSFDETNPLDGSCIDQTTTTKAPGAECDRTLDAMECADGAACLDLDGAEGADPSLCYAWCECPNADYDDQGVCNVAASNDNCAPTGTVCQNLFEGGYPLGLCLPPPAAQ